MPKKKKSNRASVGGDSAHTTPTNEETLVDCTTLQIVPSSTPPVTRLQYTPMILLTVDDADRLGVDSGDSVLLFSVADTDRLHATARALVYISFSSSSPLVTKSPSIVGKIQRSKLSAGYCHVFPVSLSQRLQGLEDVAPTSEESVVSPMSPSTPVPFTSTKTTTTTTSSTPSKTKFSFGKSGALDMWTDPPSTPKTPHNVKTSQTEKKYELWAVPVESDLGDILTERLCRIAQEVTIQTDSKILLDSSTLGPLLVRAHLASSYVSVDTSVSISVQGLPTNCRVQHIKAVGGDLLEEAFARLSVDSTLDVASRKLTSLAQTTTVTHVRLYQITNKTNIILQDVESNTVGASESYETAPTPLLAGLDDTVEKVTSLLLTPLRHPELFQQTNGLRPPKGVLLYGSSGSGKSTLAMQVSQFLNYYHKVTVHEIPCANLQARTGLVGHAEQELVRHFKLAAKSRQGSASLLVMDDVHLICSRRQGMNAGADRLAATLLALLDGIDSMASTMHESNHPVMILAITNNPSLLDPALRRPGRLDAEVEVPLPDEPPVRSKILRFQLESLNATINISEDSEEWIRLARLAKGFTGADLQLAVKEAIRMSFLSSGSATDPINSTRVDVHEMEKAIRSIKPSAIKSVTVEIPQVKWSSIGGMEDVKRRLREAIELPITHGALFRELGIRAPRGVLLYGPPGCSKTLMARALATEGHMNFLAVKGPELLSKWLGESERALASLFRRARLASPSIIFFDEVDAIATKRGGGNSGGGERLLSQLLTELDGIQSGSDVETKKRVVVVCATNRPDLLDDALMRPGRLDRMIYVGVPDHESRKKILEIGLRDKACEDDIDVSRTSETVHQVDDRSLTQSPDPSTGSRSSQWWFVGG